MFEYISFIFVVIISLFIMWVIFKFMYPKPPAAFMPKEGDVVRPRNCNLCGYPLAEYRGVLETKPNDLLTEEETQEVSALDHEQHKLERDLLKFNELLDNKDELKNITRKQKKQVSQDYAESQTKLFETKQAKKQVTTWFFCNYDHQREFHEELKK